MSFVYVGLGNVVDASSIVAIAGYNQVPIRKLVSETKPSKVIVASKEWAIKSVIFTDGGKLILSKLSPDVILKGIVSGRC